MLRSIVPRLRLTVRREELVGPVLACAHRVSRGPRDPLWPAASLWRNSLQQASTARLRCLLSRRRPKIVSSVQLACFPAGTRGTGGTRRGNDGSRWNRKGEQREQTREPKQDQSPLFHRPVPLQERDSPRGSPCSTRSRRDLV